MNLHFKILGRKDGRSNPSIRIIREPREKRWNGFLNLRNLFMNRQRNQSVQIKVILSCLFFLGNKF